MSEVPIREAARASGVKIPTIRYYEACGLLTPPARTRSNHRLYSDAHLHRLAFIRHARELGFETEAIRTLLVLQDEPRQSCVTADLIARERLAEVNKRIASLSALKVELERMIRSCKRGQVANCRVIEAVSASMAAPTRPKRHGQR